MMERNQNFLITINYYQAILWPSLSSHISLPVVINQNALEGQLLKNTLYLNHGPPYISNTTMVTRYQ